VIPPSGDAQLGEFILEKKDNDGLPVDFDRQESCPTDLELVK
jgi:hypothetical protein